MGITRENHGDSVDQEHLAQTVTVQKLSHLHLRFSGRISIESYLCANQRRRAGVHILKACFL